MEKRLIGKRESAKLCTEGRSRRSRQESAEKEEVSARRHLDRGSQAHGAPPKKGAERVRRSRARDPIRAMYESLMAPAC